MKVPILMPRFLTHHPISHPLFSRSCPHERRTMRSVWPKSGDLRVFKSGNGGLWTRNTQGKLFGNTSTHLIYDAFGNLISGANPLLFGYTGKAFDTDTDLQNTINRWYDAAIGRWLCTDPIVFEGNDSNLYRYVGNTPTRWLDYNGLKCKDCGAPNWDIQHFMVGCPAANERNKEILKNRGLTGLSPVDGQKTHGTYADSEEVAKALAELMPLIGTLLDIATLLDENAPCGDRALAAVAVGTCFVSMDSVEYVQHIKKMIKNKEDLTLIVTETKSLRRAMDKAGVHNLDKGQLHHIVCKTDKRCAPARGKIQQFETGLNSPANGVYLVQHNGRHTGGYW